MGLLIDGVWNEQWYDTKKSKGEFVRQEAKFRNWVTADGSPRPNGKGGFPAASNRYHLYVSLACPWAHRALVFRKLKKLENHISVSTVQPDMPNSHGWEYTKENGGDLDPINGVQYHYQLYTLADPTYTGRVTVPTLWDKEQKTIVSNESSEIIRMFNSEFAALTDDQVDYYPETLREEIDSVNAMIYDSINNGVYRCGFATTQDAYEKAFDQLFTALDELEERLSKQRYLVQGRLTEADWRLFTTLIRFDAVYYGHFKCNLRQIAEYPNLSNYVRDLYQQPGIAETLDFPHIKRHYYYSHETVNPTRVVPKGPILSFDAPHDRGRFA